MIHFLKKEQQLMGQWLTIGVIKRWFSILLLSGILLFFYPLITMACRGPFPKNSQEVFDKSTVVFYGRVLNIVEIGPHQSLATAKIYEARFQVYRWWKGESQKEVKVRFDTTTCGANFQRDQNYVVFASGNPLETSALSMNRLILKPEQELKPLFQEWGQGTIPH